MMPNDFLVFHHEHRLVVDALGTGGLRAREPLACYLIERTRMRLGEHCDR